MRLRDETKKRQEPDLTSLINVVFLILIFFIVAGALRPFSARDIELTKVTRKAADGVAPGRLIIQSDGQLLYRGEAMLATDLQARVAGDDRVDTSAVFTVVADARVPASMLLTATRALRAAGLKEISVMTERERR